jgi:ubiquinone/menaquinone biosynthesis C-methylase UbiE
MARTSEKKHWDDFWAESGDLDLKEVYANDDRIVENLSPVLDLAGKRVLEVGAGTGRDSETLSRLGAEAWTLDYSEQSLRLMAGHLERPVRIVCGDAFALPLASDSFDVVFHQGLLEHFTNPEDILAENLRILKPGGYVLADVPQRFHYYTLAKHILMFFDKWFAGWETEFSPRELESMVETAGFEIVATYGHNLYPPIWYRGVRKVFVRRGLKIPMHPLDSRAFRKARLGVKNALPRRFVLNTSMVVGCIGRKR